MMRVQPPQVYAWKQDVERYGWDPVRHTTTLWIGNAVYINPGSSARIQVTEENAEQYGFERYETNASKIARLEWQVEMLTEKLRLAEPTYAINTQRMSKEFIPEEDDGQSW